MGDMGDIFNDLKDHRREMRQKHGNPCAACTFNLPKAQPKILMPGEKCWCGHRDTRERIDY